MYNPSGNRTSSWTGYRSKTKQYQLSSKRASFKKHFSYHTKSQSKLIPSSKPRVDYSTEGKHEETENLAETCKPFCTLFVLHCDIIIISIDIFITKNKNFLELFLN